MATRILMHLLPTLLMILQHIQTVKGAYWTKYTGGNGDWNGWSKNTRIFAFGASYTATGFNINGVAPGPSNALGNPSSYKGYTASNGPNFIMYMTTKYNRSLIQTYNFGWAGSPVPGVVGQVKNTFIPNYTRAAPKDPGWNPSYTLFPCFVGINDLDHWNTAAKTEKGLDSYRDGVFNQYDQALTALYNRGARNFVLYTVPPLERAPEFRFVVSAKKAEIVDYNRRLNIMASAFTKRHQKATIWVVDMYTLFNKVLDKPDSFPQTASYKVLKSTCKYYSENSLKLPSMMYKDPSCQYPVNDYFWLNGRHVGYRAHDLLAKVTADALAAPV